MHIFYFFTSLTNSTNRIESVHAPFLNLKQRGKLKTGKNTPTPVKMKN